jgi:hypothetical protein
LCSLPLDLGKIWRVGQDEMRDAEIAIPSQRTGDVFRGPDEPGGSCSAGPVFSRRRVKILIKDIAAGVEVEKPLLPDGAFLLVIVPACTAGPGQLSQLYLRIPPGRLPVFLTRVVTLKSNSRGGRSRSTSRLRPFSRAILSSIPSSGSPQKSCTSASVAATRSAASDAPPKYSFGCGRSRRCSIRGWTVEFVTRKCSPSKLTLSSVHSRRTRRMKFPGSGIPMRGIAFAIPIGGEVVPAGDDIDTNAPAAQMVERGGCGGEIGGLPIAGTNGDQRLEAFCPRRKRGGHRECIGPPPAGSDKRPCPSIFLEGFGMGRERIQAVMVAYGRIAAMAIPAQRRGVFVHLDPQPQSVGSHKSALPHVFEQRRMLDPGALLARAIDDAAGKVRHAMMLCHLETVESKLLRPDRGHRRCAQCLGGSRAGLDRALVKKTE